jgi:hypothetical protein
MEEQQSYTAFAGMKIVGRGGLEAMLLGAKDYLDSGGAEALLIFEDSSGKQLDFDFRGSPAEVLARAEPRKGPGRPKLGVVSAEVSLLPRHWEWLERQSKNASATLRRLIDEARKRETDGDRSRFSVEAADRAMWSLAGNLPNCEEASRALYAGDRSRFESLVSEWPGDLRSYLLGILDSRPAEAFGLPAPGREASMSARKEVTDADRNTRHHFP